MVPVGAALEFLAADRLGENTRRSGAKFDIHQAGTWVFGQRECNLAVQRYAVDTVPAPSATLARVRTLQFCYDSHCRLGYTRLFSGSSSVVTVPQSKMFKRKGGT